MSATQKLNATWKAAPQWADQFAALMANAELLQRLTGLSPTQLLSRFVDPAPYYGQEPCDFRRRNVPELRRPPELLTAADLEAERRADERYERGREKLARRAGDGS